MSTVCGCVCTHVYKHNIVHLSVIRSKMDTLKYRKLVVSELSPDIKKGGKIVEAELRPPGKDEIIIRNYFAGVNATDMNIITGRSIFSTGGVPFDIGLEGMGTIYKVGEDVDKDQFPIGSSGLIFANPPMAYAEYLASICCCCFSKQVLIVSQRSTSSPNNSIRFQS